MHVPENHTALFEQLLSLQQADAIIESCDALGLSLSADNLPFIKAVIQSPAPLDFITEFAATKKSELLMALMECPNHEQIINYYAERGLKITDSSIELLASLVSNPNNALQILKRHEPNLSQSISLQQPSPDSVTLFGRSLQQPRAVQSSDNRTRLLTDLSSEECDLLLQAGQHRSKLIESLLFLKEKALFRSVECRSMLLEHPEQSDKLADAINFLCINKIVKPEQITLYEQRLVSSPSPLDEALQIKQEQRALEVACAKIDIGRKDSATMTVLQRYGSENQQQRSDKLLIAQTISSIADFYRQNPQHQSWMDNTASPYLEACINQPRYAIMLLTAGIELAQATDSLERTKALQFLYILHHAQALCERRDDIPSLLQAEAANLMVLQCYSNNKHLPPRPIEADVVNSDQLSDEVTAWISLQAIQLASRAASLNSAALQDFLRSDMAVQAREIWSGALFPGLMAAHEQKMQAHLSQLAEIYDHLEQGKTLESLATLSADIKAQISAQGTQQEQLDFVWREYKKAEIEAQQQRYNTIATASQSLFSPVGSDRNNLKNFDL